MIAGLGRLDVVEIVKTVQGVLVKKGRVCQGDGVRVVYIDLVA